MKPSKRLNFAANFLYMTTGREPSATVARVCLRLRTLLLSMHALSGQFSAPGKCSSRHGVSSVWNAGSRSFVYFARRTRNELQHRGCASRRLFSRRPVHLSGRRSRCAVRPPPRSKAKAALHFSQQSHWGQRGNLWSSHEVLQGANEAAVRMLGKIGSVEAVPEFIEKIKRREVRLIEIGGCL